MTWTFGTFWTACFCCLFVATFAFHYSWVKSAPQYREIASYGHKAPAKPWYDASFKY